MKQAEFVDKLNLAYKSKTKYKSGGWGSHDGDLWYFDCICLVKGILWGWKADLNLKHGGAIYASKGVPDYGETRFFNLCHNISTDFSRIHVGEMLWMKGHVGIYIGNGYVIEATKGWKKNKVVKSKVSKDGTSSLNGVKRLKWLKHGYIPYVEYEKEPEQFNLTRLLKKGCTGKDVKELQKTLIGLGYSCGKYGTDSDFGSSTEKAVKNFQKDRGLKPVDGIVGKNTAHELGWLYKGE